MTEFILPQVGTKGKFTFLAPYNNPTYESQELKVSSVRSYKDVLDSNIDILKLVYQPVGLSEHDYLEDLNNNIPLVTLETQSNKYLNVPANRIKALPDMTGVKYQQVMLVINLGILPLTTDLSTVTGIIKDDVQDAVGVTSDVEIVKSSGIIYVDKNKDVLFNKKLESKKKVKLSYRTRYYKLQEQYDALLEKQQKLEEYVKNEIEKA